MSQTELEDLYEKTNAMLNNPALKLPDGGAKLKAKLDQINTILKNENTITNGITDKVSGLSLSDKINVRKETVLRSNRTVEQPSNLLRAHDSDHTRTVRMMSLEESMKLQESQQNDIKMANMRKKMESVRGSMVPTDSLADDLTMTMNSLQLDPETRVPRPDDDGPSDGEGDDADSDDSDELEYYERYDDEGFEEDEDQEFEDGQQHNNNNRRV
ncbi:unnamed protein product [Mucor hiemalis]